MREVLVIGGTGAQGLPVVKCACRVNPVLLSALLDSVPNLPAALSSSQRFAVRVLTRDAKSARAQELEKLPNVTLVEGRQDNQQDLHRAFHGVYGAWVNTDGFTLGEKNELFYGCRAYEIARHEGVQHYVYACADFALKHANWDENFHWGHNDAKGRVAEYILAQGQEGMRSSVITTGPYMDMLWDGMFVPTQQPDGSFVWANPARTSFLPTSLSMSIGHEQ
jgi:hypothetical protein